MNKTIVTDSTKSEKSTDEIKKTFNNARILQDYRCQIISGFEGIKQWEAILKDWTYKEKISVEEFEAAYIMLCQSGLADWVNWGIDMLYETMTHEKFNPNRFFDLGDKYIA